jgi:diacylglycerol kinase
MLGKIFGIFIIFYKKIIYAWEGLKVAVKTELSFKAESVVIFLAIILGLVLRLDRTEWCLVLLSISAIWSRELFNTAMEKTLNLMQPAHDEKVGVVKDIAAASVLIANLTAIVIFVLVFGPRIIHLFVSNFSFE